MAKGKRTPEEVKIKTANRIARGEDVEVVAKEMGFSVSTIKDWVKHNKPTAKRKVATNSRKPRPNALKVENENLKREVAFWRDAYLTEYRKNSLSSQ